MSESRSLLKHQGLWRARDLERIQEVETSKRLSTGFASLDAALSDNGWPRAALIEVLCSTTGIGELRLLAPGLAQLSREETRWIVWVNPPFVPYAPAWQRLGVDLEKVLVIRSDSRRDALWSLEQVLESGSCSAVMAWLNERGLQHSELRRLQIRSRQGRTWTTLFRPRPIAKQPSPAELRLAVDLSDGGGVTVSVLKRRRGWALNDLSIPLSANPIGRSPETLEIDLDESTVERSQEETA